MSLRFAPTRRLAASAAVAAAALLLAGCGTGQDAQTYQEKAVADATNASVGAIAVRNLAVEGPDQGTLLRQGTDAPMTITLVNEGGQDDALVSATTPAARSVQVVGPTPDLPVPRLSTADARYSLLLQDLTRDLPTGTYISMTLTFQRNGTKDLLVPVQLNPEGTPRPSSTYEVVETDSAGKPLVAGDTPVTE